jgi:hypothetical protein
MTGRTVAKDLAAICQKAMAEDSSKRYESAAELRRWLGGEPTKVRAGWLTLCGTQTWSCDRPRILGNNMLALGRPVAVLWRE